MRYRGEVFWAWADPELQRHSHEEVLSGGALLDVQVRLSRCGDTQLFIGIYEPSGLITQNRIKRSPGPWSGAPVEDVNLPDVLRSHEGQG